MKSQKKWKPKVEWRNPAELIPYVNNAKIHTAEQIGKVAGAISAFGFTTPIVVDKEGVIIAGHCRREASLQLLMKEVPVVVADHLTPEEVTAARIADNRVAESPWNMELLKFDLGTLDRLDFDLKSTGFEVDEIKSFLEIGELPSGIRASDEKSIAPAPTVEAAQPDPKEDEVPEVPKDPKSKLGDLYQLGRHFLLCGDATDREQVEHLMGVEKADMVFTDPPYGIDHSGKGITGDAPGGNSFGKILGDKDISVAVDSFKLVSAIFPETTLIFWGANYYCSTLLSGFGWIVWDKEREGTTFSGAELAFVNRGIRLDVFRHMWHGMIKASEMGQARVHPTQKPVALAEWCFENYGDPKKVLDLFGGSGSTLIACEKTQRRCFMMELDPKYVDVIVARWEKFTGQKAELIEN